MERTPNGRGWAALVGVGATALLVGLTSAAANADPATTSADAAGSWRVAASVQVEGTFALAVDPLTHTIYSTTFVPTTPTDYVSGVTVIDGATNAIVSSQDGLGSAPFAAAVNSVTRKVYIPYFGSSEIVVFDGATNTVSSTLKPANSMPVGVAIDEATDTVYVTDGNDNGFLPEGVVYVIDGATDTITDTIPVGDNIAFPAVDSAEHKLYVPIERTDEGETFISVIDTTTNAVVGTIQPTGASAIASVVVDPTRNRAYALDPLSRSVFTIDTETDAVVGDPIPVGGVDGRDLSAFAVDPVADRLFVGGSLDGDATVFVVDPESGDTDATVPLTGFGNFSIAVDSAARAVYANAVSETDAGEIRTIRFVPDGTPTPTPTSTSAAPADPSLANTGASASVVIAGATLALAAIALGIALARRRRAS